MSDSFLAAVIERHNDRLSPPPPPPAPPPLPPPPTVQANASSWKHGFCEVESFYKASSKAAGSQAVVAAEDGDALWTRCFEGNDEEIGIYSLRRGAVRSLKGHADVVCALSGDGDRLASASADGTVRLWEVSSGNCFAKAIVGVEALSVCLRGNFLCSGDADNTAKLWQLGTGDATRVWKGYKDSADGTKAVVTLPSCHKSMSHRGSVYCSCVTESGTVSSIGWNQNDLRIWSLAGTAHEIATPAAVTFAMAGQAELVFVGVRSGHVVSYSISSGQMVHHFACNTARKEVTAIDVFDTWLATACEHGPQGLRLWSLAGPKPELVATHDVRHAVSAVTFCTSSGHLVSTGTDEEMEVWAPAAASCK